MLTNATRTMCDIERTVRKHAERSSLLRAFHARYDKEKIQGWKLDLQKILGIFNVSIPSRMSQVAASKAWPTLVGLKPEYLFRRH